MWRSQVDGGLSIDPFPLVSPGEESVPVSRLCQDLVLLPDLSVTQAGRWVVARLDGPLDREAASRLLERLEPLCPHTYRLILDLRRTTYADSDGVRALLRLEELLHAARGDLRLVVPPEGRVLRTLTLLRLNDHFTLHDSVVDAWVRSEQAA